MESTVINILESAKKIGAKSLSMTGISAGMQGFPLELSSNIIINQCVKWALLQKYLDSKNEGPKNSLKKIRLLMWSLKEVAICKKQFKNIKNIYESDNQDKSFD